MKYALIALVSLPVFASTYKLDPAGGTVSFVAKSNPALMTINGKGRGVTGELLEQTNVVSGTITFRLDTLTTDNDTRDDHMRNKYLEVAKYPDAKLSVTKLELPADRTKPFTFKARLTLHGETREVDVEARLDDGKLEAKFPLRLSEFKIEIPSFKGITVAEQVAVTLATQIKAE